MSQDKIWFIQVERHASMDVTTYGAFETKEDAMEKAEELMDEFTDEFTDEFVDDKQEYERDNTFGEAVEKYAVMESEWIHPTISLKTLNAP